MQISTKLVSLFIAALFLVASAAGCGGGQDTSNSNPGNSDGVFSVRADTTVTDTSLSKAQFITRMNKICRHGWHVILADFAKYSGWQGPNLSRKDLYAKAIRNSFLSGLDFEIFDEFRFLGAPREEANEVEEVIGPMQIAVERGQRQVPVTNAGILEALFSEYNLRAQQYGLKDCLVSGAHLPRLHTAH